MRLDKTQWTVIVVAALFFGFVSGFGSSYMLRTDSASVSVASNDGGTLEEFKAQTIKDIHASGDMIVPKEHYDDLKSIIDKQNDLLRIREENIASMWSLIPRSVSEDVFSSEENAHWRNLNRNRKLARGNDNE